MEKQSAVSMGDVRSDVTGLRSRLIASMAGYLRYLEYDDIKARVDGEYPPDILEGTVQSHRPDLLARKNKNYIVIEAVTKESFNGDSENRWSLLLSAVKLWKAELHFVVSDYEQGHDTFNRLKFILNELNIVPTKIWRL